MPQKKLLLTCTATFWFTAQLLTIHAQGQGHLIFGRPNHDYGQAIVHTQDGGYLFAGYSFAVGWPDIFVAKFQTNGSTQWIRVINANKEEYVYSIIQTTDGGYILTGSIYAWNDIDDIIVIRLDANGNLLWAKTIGDPANREEAYAIIQTTDGNFVLAGYTRSFGQGSTDVYIIKLDSAGNMLWSRVIGGNADDMAADVIQTTDNGFLLTGVTHSFGQGNGDILVIKLDSNGNLQWTRTIGGNNTDWGADAVQADDGGYVITGVTSSFGQGTYDVYILKLDSSGNLLWTRTIGGTNDDRSYAIAKTNEGKYIITGYTKSFGQGNEDIYLIKLDNNGNINWRRTIGRAQKEWGFSIVQTPDGGYAIAGTIDTTGQATLDFYILKLDAHGNTNPACPEKIDSGGVILPDSGQLTTPTPAISYNAGTVTPINVSITSSGNTYLCGSLCAIDTGIAQHGDTLIALTDSASYQWLNCENGYTPIPGATQPTFVPSTTGTYAVEITLNGCVDTSSCYLICIVDTTVIQQGDTLIAQAHTATYQWLNCNADYAPIPGATDSIFLPDTTGSYAVQITQNGCVDTSSCYYVEVSPDTTGSGTTAIPQTKPNTNIHVIPHATQTGWLVIFPDKQQYIEVMVTDLTGQILYQHTAHHVRQLPIPIQLPTGIYLLTINQQTGTRHTILLTNTP